MPTEVYPFLPNPTSPAHLREAYPYGPASSGFHPDLAIEIDPSQLAQTLAVVVVSGMARLILDPLSPQTCTLVLIPNYYVMADLSTVLGKTVVAFVYRNLTKYVPPPTLPAGGSSVDLWPERPLDDFRMKIKNLKVPTIPVPDRTEQLRQFLQGETYIEVVAGDTILTPSINGGLNGWGRLGFEIVFVPSGLLGEHGWARLQELIDPNATTRRLDPMSFYTRVKAASDPLSLAAPQDHALFTQTTHRSLLELRNEYDQPFVGTAFVYDGGLTTPFDSLTDNRGTFAFPANTTFSNVEVPEYVITELPSGDKAEPANKNFTTTDHWALQLIYMSQNPALVDDEGWFVANPVWQRYTENNKITVIRDGVEVFRQFAEAIRTINQSGHFLYLANWWIDKSFRLIEDDPASTMAQLTRHVDSHNAIVRALLWGNHHDGQNSSENYDINHLNGGNGMSFLDVYTHDCTTLPKTGTHHQKFLVVYGSQGEFAFCGGVDLNQNRRDSPKHGAIGGYHDVHAKVEGPAVADIHRTFAERWNANPDNHSTLLFSGTDKYEANAGSVFVQVAQTYPRRSTQKYPFAPQGSKTPLQAFLRAITKAKKFIYIEDQYLTPYPGGFPYSESEDTVGVLKALREALSNIDYLIMVVPNHARQGWLYNIPFFLTEPHPGQNRYRRMIFIKCLKELFPDKVHVFYLSRSGSDPGPGEVATTGDGPHTSGSPAYPNEIYCHSKVWIIDDVIAKIGSANCNRRSYTHDTEMDIVMVDGALDNGARRFARDFRLQLWAEHLDIPQSEKGILEDHKLALHYWREGRFSGAHISDYDHTNLGLEIVGGNELWDTYVDPDGIN